MTARPTRRKKTLPEPDQGRAILERTLALLVGNGYTPAALRMMAAEICAAMPEPRNPRDPARSTFTAELGHVLTHWYTDPLNLDAEGHPRPLPVRGAGPSISRLVRRASPSLDVKLALQQLLKSGSLRRVGRRYVPTGRRVLFNPKDAVATARGLLPVLGYLDTFDFNLNRRGKQAPRFEVTAIHPSFPIAALETFKRRLMARGMDFLHEIDNQMQRAAERESPSAPRSSVGVGVFLFEVAASTHPRRLDKRRR